MAQMLRIMFRLTETAQAPMMSRKMNDSEDYIFFERKYSKIALLVDQKQVQAKNRIALLVEQKQKEEDGTAIEFYKKSRIRKDGKWVCQEALQIYQKIIELQKERNPDQKYEAIAEEIFTEVLGHVSGYVRGMGKSMIPPPVSESHSAKVAQMSN
ncbi:hypothetical protein CJ030_MR2G011738 [Morella rubra]|uniref:Uncharacterized protein n=1 Tax=Morella rubra TaxID=262757 RepID=A0A6A1WEE7_9ROSI|nr:hypothetical protein CJ030_MR2G011738 [Morella rubra]